MRNEHLGAININIITILVILLFVIFLLILLLMVFLLFLILFFLLFILMPLLLLLPPHESTPLLAAEPVFIVRPASQRVGLNGIAK